MIDENWAVSLERAQEFFLSQPDVTPQNGGISVLFKLFCKAVDEPLF